mgnify:CR=1 FL=1
MKKIILFDMDGTLTPARQAMSVEVANELYNVQKAGFEIGILTGSGLDYIKQQCKPMFEHELLNWWDIHYLPCNGTKYYKLEQHGMKLVYEENMAKYLSESRWKVLMRIVLGLQSSLINTYEDIPLTGNFISYRGSTLNWCPIGRQAEDSDRSAWIELDKTHSIRQEWLNLARSKFDATCLGDVMIKLGGDTSFDIYPKGWDKTYAFTNFAHYKEIYFIGDRCEGNGNDTEAYKLAGELGYSTTGPEQTIEIIKKILENK